MRCDSRCVDLLIAAAVFSGQTLGPMPVHAEASATPPTVREILKEARRIATQSPKLRGHFLQNPLLDITRLQIQAGDFDAALADLTTDNEYERDRLLTQIAEAIARSGRRKRAEQVMQRVEPHFCCDEDRLVGRRYLDEAIRLAFIDYQIADGNLTGARQTAAEITTPSNRSSALKKLAEAYVKAGDLPASRQTFRDAVSAAASTPIKKLPPGVQGISDEYYIANQIWAIADSQLEVGDQSGAAETLRRLLKAVDGFHDGRSRTEALLQTAAREARLGDHSLAKRLFQQALDNCPNVTSPADNPEDNKAYCWLRIAKAQAAAGYYDDAMKTARLIPKDKSEAWDASVEITTTRAKKGDIAGAVATALSLEPDRWSRTQALVAIVRLQIQKHDLRGAVLTTEKIGDPLERAIASLKIAAAFAEGGDHKSAEITVGRIRLSPNKSRSRRPVVVFDLERPGTWGTIYNETGFFSLSSHQGELQDAAKLASAAMTLSQRMNKHYPTSYAALFADFDPIVVRRLARAHAATGSPAEALSWARQIGSTQRDQSKADWEAERPIERRLAALLGTAEGILERQGRLSTEPQNAW
jgi:tetratricopeptide (TPR) repeat protein